ncbi:MAG: hypothetical protein D3925_00130 [Candidatus Electrothrix sp. AR5]|nr:hypothetical protein [Candidatus Electrothrix sp. AR5]
MISIKNNFGEIKITDNLLIELVFFIVKVIGLVFLLHLAAGGYPGDVKIKFSELTTVSHHSENIILEKKTGWVVQQKKR